MKLASLVDTYNMTLNGAQIGTCPSTTGCTDKFGCSDSICADFMIKQHDTQPPFRVAVNDCDGPLDLTDTTLVLEVNMWAKARLKAAITTTDTYFALADNIGFEQAMIGDIIVMDRVRMPEKMLVVGFDEVNSLIQVQRGYDDTPVSSWKKGDILRIFRIVGQNASIITTLQDITQEDGTILEDQIASTFLEYSWSASDVCLPGCYYFEFKLLKMALLGAALSEPISFTSGTISDYGCTNGEGVEWVRRFPTQEGFLIRILPSPTSE